jgi:hypothetical protein
MVANLAKAEHQLGLFEYFIGDLQIKFVTAINQIYDPVSYTSLYVYNHFLMRRSKAIIDSIYLKAR